MNLQASIELQAGGTGSGCRGSNCGRHALLVKWIDHPTKGVISSSERGIQHYEMMDQHGINQAAYDRLPKGYAGWNPSTRVLRVVGPEKSSSVEKHLIREYGLKPARVSFERADMNQLYAQALFQGVQLEGFTNREEEYVRAGMSRVPPELLKNVKTIRADRGLGAKHGNYDPKTKTIRLSPRNFFMRLRLGKGPGWMQHAEVTIVHEIGHSVYETLSQERKDEWSAISGWIKTATDRPGYRRYVERRPGWPAYTSQWIRKPGVGFSRKYAEKTPDEDFADSFAFFLLGKAFQISPKKRKFLEQLIKSRVCRYPQALIQSPSKA